MTMPMMKRMLLLLGVLCTTTTSLVQAKIRLADLEAVQRAVITTRTKGNKTQKNNKGKGEGKEHTELLLNEILSCIFQRDESI